jgi:hypothetical protein
MGSTIRRVSSPPAQSHTAACTGAPLADEGWCWKNLIVAVGFYMNTWNVLLSSGNQVRKINFKLTDYDFNSANC